ncbi:hypothetical protein DFH09DRAFT_1420517 [Mycena vulgaris]|nr:hypothetical protein DFH09DRAFT_1420517 [Mycena vulgaris]
MSPTRIVAVFCATGLQGSAVVHALLKDGTFTPRAISRDPTSAAALKLKASGAEVVKGDPLDKASLLSALRGSEAVFGVTIPIYPLKAEGEGPNEWVQGKNMVDAAKEVGVKFFIFSSLPSIAKISGGKYTSCLHYEQKVAVDEYLRSSGLANASLYLGIFLENFWTMGFLKKTTTGFNVAVPNYTATARASFTWVERDVPAVTLALLKNYTDPSKGISGKYYPVINENTSFGDVAARTGKAIGAEVTFASALPIGVQAIDEIFAAHAESNGIYTTPVPNPDLVALGVKFGTIDEFLATEVKSRFGQ